MGHVVDVGPRRGDQNFGECSTPLLLISVNVIHTLILKRDGVGKRKNYFGEGFTSAKEKKDGCVEIGGFSR